MDNVDRRMTATIVILTTEVIGVVGVSAAVVDGW